MILNITQIMVGDTVGWRHDSSNSGARFTVMNIGPDGRAQLRQIKKSHLQVSECVCAVILLSIQCMTWLINWVAVDGSLCKF